MLRLQPTVISLTAGEVKDAETRRRFRRHLIKTDAQQNQQNRELSQSPNAKDGNNAAPTHEPEGVLTNSPPQSPRVPAQFPSSPLPPPTGLDQRPAQGQEVTSSPRQSSVLSRSWAMTPRRFPHPLHAEVSQHSLGQQGRLDSQEGQTASPHGNRSLSINPSVLPEGSGHPQPGSVPDPGNALQEGQGPVLPPPFSLTRRVTSGEFWAALSIQDSHNRDREEIVVRRIGTVPPATPVRRSSRSATSPRRSVSEEQHADRCFINVVEPNTDTRSRRVPSRSRHKDNAPSTSTGSSPGSGTTITGARTVSRVRVYNDSVPAEVQPETPQNLPEARHQSRLQGSYTMPPARGTPVEVPTPTTSRQWRHAARRNPTPAGLQTPGFLGLYGGIENGDEVALFEHAHRESEARAYPRSRSSSLEV